jgi:putative PIN family toxin of toxin-antitoxin system
MRKALLLSRRRALKLVSEAVQTVAPPTAGVIGVCRDPNDDAILNGVLAAGVDYLVTGDADLLELRNCKGIRIIAPRDFELLFAD